MPRYRYTCSECDVPQMVFHLYEEKPEVDCRTPECEGNMNRSITKPLITQSTEILSSTGEITNEFIEESREALKQQQQEAEESTYEPS
jgi:predicted nucleic acid-binding Zn ribbon protein